MGKGICGLLYCIIAEQIGSTVPRQPTAQPGLVKDPAKEKQHKNTLNSQCSHLKGSADCTRTTNRTRSTPNSVHRPIRPTAHLGLPELRHFTTPGSTDN